MAGPDLVAIVQRPQNAVDAEQVATEEHASLLLTQKPVRLIYTDTKEPFIANRLDADRKAAQKHFEELRVDCEKKELESGSVF